MPGMAAGSYGVLEQEASMIHLPSANTEKVQPRPIAPDRGTLRSFATGLGLCLVVAVLAGCGSSNGSFGGSSAAPQSHSVSSGGNTTSNTTGGSTTTTSATPGSQNSGPPYLVKSLQVTIEEKDTRAAAGKILAWITATDTR